MKNVETKNFKSNYYWDYLVKNPNSIKTKFTIFAFGRGGSILFHSLLDGHSKLLHFNKHIDFLIYKKILRDLLGSRLEAPKEECKNFIKQVVDEEWKNYYNMVPKEIGHQNKINIKEFEKNIDLICENISLDKLNLDIIFNIIFIAYGKTHNRPLSTKTPHMIIQLHTMYNSKKKAFSDLIDRFENLHFLFSINDLIKALDSSRKVYLRHLDNPKNFSHWHHGSFLIYFKKYYSISLFMFFEPGIKNLIYSFYSYKKKKFNNISYICLEDLHCKTKNVMTDFCRLAEINFEEILLKDTFNSKENSVFSASSGKILSGTSRERGQDNSISHMDNIDICLYELIISKKIIESLGYKLRIRRLTLLKSFYKFSYQEKENIKILSDILKKIEKEFLEELNRFFIGSSLSLFYFKFLIKLVIYSIFVFLIAKIILFAIKKRLWSASNLIASIFEKKGKYRLHLLGRIVP